MSDFTEALKGLTLNELYRVYASNLDSMQGMGNIYYSEERTYKLSRLIIINNAIRERENAN